MKKIWKPKRFIVSFGKTIYTINMKHPKKKTTYKKGDRVAFTTVTRKYACRGGIIKEQIPLYTDDTIKYPSLPAGHPHAKAINIYREYEPGRRELIGYIIHAINMRGEHVEDVCVTEGFIRGAFN